MCACAGVGRCLDQLARSRVTFELVMSRPYVCALRDIAVTYWYRYVYTLYYNRYTCLSRAIDRRERLSSFLGSLLPVTFSSPPLSGLALVWLLLYPVVRSVSVCCCCRRARSLSLSLPASSLANFWCIFLGRLFAAAHVLFSAEASLTV